MNKPARGAVWYREPQVWLLIAFPLAAVLGCAVTIALAITSNDGVVRDDYYRHGLAINQRLAREDLARRLGYAATVTYSAGDSTIAIALSGPATAPLPPRMRLTLSHATRDRLDQVVDLTGDRLMRARIPQLQSGRWYAEVASPDWRIVRILVVP